jgi:imidazolonepropionase-like amidohydrolase
MMKVTALVAAAGVSLAAIASCTPATKTTARTASPAAEPVHADRRDAPAVARGITMLTSPPPPLGADRVVFTLHKFLAEVGVEIDTYVALPGGGTEAKALFSYRDRRSMVPLAASFTFGSTGALERYAAWGRTSRFTKIDDRIDARTDGGFDVRRADAKVTRVVPGGLAVVGSGYAPMLAQELMLRAWSQHGRPAKIALLPEGEVAIESRGNETYDGATGKVTLEHVAVSGLLWGREDAWLDEHGSLAAVITRDAEFDHHEATREGFDSLLPELARKSGADGVAWLAGTAKGAARSAPGAFALVGGSLIDGTGKAPVRDAVVVVEGDRILAAGPRATVTIPQGATTIDVAGASILPGLWDMHAHVEQVEQGLVYLAAGVTTVRDMGNVLDFITGVRDAIDAGKGLGPRLLVDGLVDGSGDATLGTVRVTTREEIAPTIDRLKKAGCIEVKIYSSVAPALVKPIIAYAHAHGMRAVGHVPFGMTTAAAVDAGFDSISHMSYLFDAVLPDSETKDLSRDEYLKRLAAVDLSAPAMTKLMASLRSHHVVIDDTVSLDEQGLHTLAENAKLEPGIATLPRELKATLGGLPSAAGPLGEAAFAKYIALLAALHARGIPVVAGTDINVPGHSLHRELELYVKAGFTPMEAIQAATVVPARYMQMDRELGTVERGKRADLVVVRGDPLADIAAVRRTELVVTRGRVYDAASLWKLAGFEPARGAN